MKKIILTCMMLMLLAIPANAEDTITEKPDLNITINGTTNEYTDIPLIVNDRTMLPLRELLVNLGVPNDDEHIIWNGEERSVTAVTDTATIKLAINSATATVNGEEVTLDAPAMIYAENSRTYIPARFVSEALGMTVAWDAFTASVLIRDTADYETTLAFLDSAYTSLDDLTEYTTSLNYNIDYAYAEETRNSTLALDMQLSKTQEAIHMNLILDAPSEDGTYSTIYGETYDIGGYSYYNNDNTDDNWARSESLSDYTLDTTTDTNKMFVEANDVNASSMIIIEETDTTVTLTGSSSIEAIILHALNMSPGGSKNKDELDITGSTLTMIIDKATSLPTAMTYQANFITTDTEGLEITTNIEANITIAPLTEDYIITLPEEVESSFPAEEEEATE